MKGHGHMAKKIFEEWNVSYKFKLTIVFGYRNQNILALTDLSYSPLIQLLYIYLI